MTITVKDNATHLHRDDCPHAVALLAELANGHDVDGLEPTQFGMRVEWWELFNRSHLSTSELGVVHLAHGIAVLERHGGGIPSRLGLPVWDALKAVLP